MISIPKPTPMRKMHNPPTWRRKTSGLLADTPEPDQEPYIPEGSVEEAFKRFQVSRCSLSAMGCDRFSLEWLDVADDRLGMTRFDEGRRLVRRRKLRPTGPITIGLHPALLQDEALKHTFVHELLHAVGLTIHSKQHDKLVSQIAPAPSLKESPLLQKMRDVLGNQTAQSWTCGHWLRMEAKNSAQTKSMCEVCSTAPLIVTFLKSEPPHPTRTYSVVWISPPSKPKTRVRILVRPPI